MTRNRKSAKAPGARFEATTLTFPAPAPMLTLNQRLHFRKRNEITQQWRKAGATLARAAKLQPMERALITVTFAFPTKGHKDIHNFVPTAKALIDGLVTDAGLLPNDCDCYLTLDIRRGPKTESDSPVVTIQITPIPDSTRKETA